MIEKLTKKWWFYLVCIIVFFLPSITEKQVGQEEISGVIQEVMQRPLIYEIVLFYPISKALIVFLLIGALIWKNKFKKYSLILFIILLAFIMVFQNISVETNHGYAILTGNILLILIVVGSWIYEFYRNRNDFSEPKFRIWNIFIFILASFAFWMPARDGKVFFAARDIVMNESGLTFCMVTPIILAILFLYYPHVNTVTLRVTSFVGLMFGVINMITWFFLNTEYWWMGICHLPLLINSLVGFILSVKQNCEKGVK